MMRGVFIPDRDPRFHLLARHRQPLAANVAQAYIDELTTPGDLVVDPFAATPTAARLALQSGRRAIAVDSNPLIAFAARLEATLPTPREIQVALARWGDVPRENETLRQHIEEQYATLCANCGAGVVANYFVWSRDLNLPVEKVYHCARCGARRDPATESDRTRAAAHKPRGFHFHLILERLAAAESAYYNLLRERLALYTARNLYILVTLTLKLEVATRDEAGRQVLLGCLLHALDTGASVYPTVEALPERKIPPTFIEVNIWRALEQAAAGLAQLAPGIAIAAGPEAVASTSVPALYVGHGSTRALAQNLNGAARLILTSPARLDPLFWELSYLWTRWLLGKQAARPLEPFLEEERQRWGWYGNALVTAMRDAAQLLTRDGHWVAAFPSGSHAMVQALTMAAAPVFQLDALAFRPHRGVAGATEFGALRGDYRLTWSRQELAPPAQSAHEVSQDIRTGAQTGAKQILDARAEALPYSWLHHGAITALARAGTLAQTLNAPMHPRDNSFQFLHREIEAGLKEGYAHDFDHRQAGGHVLWLRYQETGHAPLTERVEQSVREILESERQIPLQSLEEQVLERFPELLTPEIELVEACVTAYADMVSGEWRWREQDMEGLARVHAQVTELGTRLGFEVIQNGDGGMVWRDEKIIPGSSGGAIPEHRIREDSHLVHIHPHPDPSALRRHPASPLRGLVVLPENQVALTREKLRRIPNLNESLTRARWEFLRSALVEQLLLYPTLTRAEFQLALGLEPPLARGEEQLGLF
ncbi:MAG: hypothetical protein WCF84_19440 [Anaerolineae bacterium]